MGRTWGRLYCGTRHHRKIRILRQRCPDSWWIFYPLLEMAIETDDDGRIYLDHDLPYTLEDLALEVGLSDVTLLENTLQNMAELRLVELDSGIIRFRSYNDRQFKSDADGAERVRRHREKARERVCNGDVTLHNRRGNGDVTPPDTDTDTESTPLTPRKRGDDVAPGFDDRTPATDGAGSTKAHPRNNGYDPEFEAWWAEYPPRRKTGKPKVYAKWKALRAQGQLLPLDQMLSVLRAQKQSPDWTKNGGDYIPGPHPYLNQFRFLDESVQSQRYSPASPRADPDCPVCHGDGWELFEQDGREFSRRCRCWQVRDG